MANAAENAAPAVTDAATLPAPVARSSVATDIALIASFAAFIAVCAILPGIPTGTSVPITLQTFGVTLAGLVLGWRRGGLAVLLYLVLGLAGLPIFSGGAGGVAVLQGASAGYLLAFPVGAVVAGLLAGRGLSGADRFVASTTASALAARFDRLGEGLVPARRHPTRLVGSVGSRIFRSTATWRYVALFVSGLGASFLVIHPAGIVGLMHKFDISFHEALLGDLPFWPGDIIKNLAAAGVALAIFRAFPDMLRNRR
ncbi:biotin transporter BioY [Cellulomonas sp. URHD0024]|uniref:biotin transporter BioY n=1 Tax=Cellulomonas sp. URHD0024 TaxID=1302620 RepID=UPI000407EF1B|nr:biotin transporter BioY [Cellulomonas sp. URHD0024]